MKGSHPLGLWQAYDTMNERPLRFPSKLILLGIVLYLGMQALVTGIPTIGGSSEAREAQVIGVIARDGTWVLPLRNGIIPSKPPLYHWSAACLSALVGGVSEFSVRFASQVAAVFVVLFVSLVAFRFAAITGPRLSRVHPRRSAVLAAGITSLTYGFYIMANQAMVDMTFTFCVWGALMSAALTAGSSSPARLGARLGFFLFCALGVLARGPLGLLFPVFLVVVAGTLCVGLGKTLRELLRPSIAWLVFCIPLGWYYLAYNEGGEAFLQRQILFENLKRFSGGEHVNSESWWFYGPSFARTTFPWGLLLVVLGWKGGRSPRTVSYPGPSWLVQWLPSLVCLAGIALLSLSSGKRHSYLLPLAPLVAVQLAVEFSRLFELGGDRIKVRCLLSGRRCITVNTAVVVSVLGVGAVLSGLDYADFPRIALAVPPLLQVIERFGLVLVAIVAFGSLSIRRSHDVVFLALWFQFASLLTLAVNAGTAVKAHLKGFDEMASVWLSTAQSGEELAVIKHPFDEYFDPMLFYARRPVRIISTESESFRCEERVVYVAKRQWLEERRESLQGVISQGMILRERLLAQADDSRRDVVLFRCGTTVGNTPSSVQTPAMKEARLILAPQEQPYSL